jgi:hypothetical protein
MKKHSIPLLVFVLIFLLTGCSIRFGGQKITVKIMELQSEQTITIARDSTVTQALLQAGVLLEPLDKVEPASSTVLGEDSTIKIIRVREDFLIEQSIVPFEQQTVKNESLPEGQTVLIQAGANGTQQNTFRILYEDGVETTRSFVNSEIIQPPKPEIIMIGVQSPFTAQPIPGMIAYITSSNVWVMEGNSGNRRPVVSTGDLDGRVFSISPDGQWLLFTRSQAESEDINSLWIVNLTTTEPQPIDTGVKNIVNYADWVPGRSRSFSYSTVDPVPTAPGWNANNDLYITRFDESGTVIDSTMVLDKNSGGLSGWWGTSFEWSNDGSRLAYARPDSIGLVDLDAGTFNPLLEFPVYQTNSDWAWVPSLKWSADDKALFTTAAFGGAEVGTQAPSMAAVLLDENKTIELVSNCGLFCYPVPSPFNINNRYSVAFLSAIIPDQSQTSRYNLRMVDRDGSNPEKFYPGEGLQGLSPQIVKWSPNFLDEPSLAFVAQGDLLILDILTGSINNLTGDGSISRIDWK